MEFEGRISIEVRKQEKLDIVEEKDFKRGELPGKYTAKILYKWNNRRFENKYLRKLEKNWQRQKEKDSNISFSRSKNLEEGVISDI